MWVWKRNLLEDCGPSLPVSMTVAATQGFLRGVWGLARDPHPTWLLKTYMLRGPCCPNIIKTEQKCCSCPLYIITCIQITHNQWTHQEQSINTWINIWNNICKNYAVCLMYTLYNIVNIKSKLTLFIINPGSRS